MQTMTVHHRKRAREFCPFLMYVKCAFLVYVKLAQGLCWHFQIITSELPMMDVVMLAIGFVFFALSIGYVYACDRL